MCDQYQVHLIADEIAVGCGRTGRFFATEGHARPDFLCLSKGISGGYLPLSVVLTRDEIYQAFYVDATARGFLHSHSYTGNPLDTAATDFSRRFFAAALSQNLLLRPIGNTVYFMPPYVLDEDTTHWLGERALLALDAALTS